MDFVGKRGVFNAYEDLAWGSYAGKTCTVIKYDVERYELLVEFEDAVRLTIGVDEFNVILN